MYARCPKHIRSRGHCSSRGFHWVHPLQTQPNTICTLPSCCIATQHCSCNGSRYCCGEPLSTRWWLDGGARRAHPREQKQSVAEESTENGRGTGSRGEFSRSFSWDECLGPKPQVSVEQVRVREERRKSCTHDFKCLSKKDMFSQYNELPLHHQGSSPPLPATRMPSLPATMTACVMSSKMPCSTTPTVFLSSLAASVASLMVSVKCKSTM